MKATRIGCLGLALVLICGAAVSQTPPAAAQASASTPPRTADGHPDFQGNWTNRWATPLERPAGETRLDLPASEAAGFAARVASTRGSPGEAAVRDPNAGLDITGLLTIGGSARSSLVIDPADGRVPYTREARERRAALPPNGNAGDEGAERRGPAERCLGANAGLAPFLTMPSGNIRQIVQTGSHIAVLTESFSQLRIIPFGGYGPAGRGGRSSAHWDGDVLVIRTAGYSATDIMRGSAAGLFLSSPATEITERFERISTDEILYRFTVADPTLYTRPWTGESLLKRTRERMYEVACHEGNYSMTNILRAARLHEAKTSP